MFIYFTDLVSSFPHGDVRSLRAEVFCLLESLFRSHPTPRTEPATSWNTERPRITLLRRHNKGPPAGKLKQSKGILCPHSPGGWKPELKVSAGLVLLRPVLGLSAASSPCPRTVVPVCVCVHSSSSLWGHQSQGVRTRLVASFYLNPLFKARLQIQLLSGVRRVRTSTCEFQGTPFSP